MTKRRPMTNAGRLNALEAELQPKDKPTIVICPSLDYPDLYYVSGKPGDLMPKQELIARLEKDYTVIVVTYVKDWNNYKVD